MHARTLLAISIVVAAPALRAQAPDVTPYLPADRAAEVALARTAAPADVSANATILVLTPKGYIQAAPGTNGFTCLVMRSFAAAPGDPQFWNPHISAPHCFNPPAARTVLPALLAQIDWALAGATPAELRERMRNAYAVKRFTMPAAGSMAHLMFYYARALKAAMFGAGGMTAPIIDASAGDRDAPVQVIYIPVRTWSDGTPAVH